MSLEEFEDEIDPKTRRYIGMKSLMDIGMGIIYLLVGGYILFGTKFTVAVLDNKLVSRIFAVAIILYGLFRIYRGIKKDYFRQ